MVQRNGEREIREEIAHHAQQRDELVVPRTWTFKKNLVRALGRRSQAGVRSRLSPDPLIGTCGINRHKASLAPRLPGC